MRVGHGLALPHQDGKGGAQHLAQRFMGIARQPAQRFQQLAMQQRCLVQEGDRLAQLRYVVRDLPGVDHDANQFAGTEWHLHPSPDIGGRRHLSGRRQIIECPRQRHGQGDAQERKGGHGLPVYRCRQATLKACPTCTSLLSPA